MVQCNIYLPVFRQYFATAIVSLCLMSDGMQFGWQSPANKYLTSNETKIKGYNDNISTINQVMFLVGGVGVSPLVSYLADKIGRKWSSVIGSSLNFISWLSIGFTTFAEVLIFSKILASIAYCFDMIIIPMYVSEISEKRIRGFFLAYILLSAMFGIIVIYAIFPYIPVLASSAVGACLNIIHITIIIFIPDSPYFLLKKEKEEKATKSLQYFRGNKDINAEIKEMKEGIAMEKLLNVKLIEIIKDPHSKRALVIGCVLQFMVPFGCLSLITMNLHTILGDNRVLFPEDFTSIGFACTLFFSQILCMCIIDFFGRKPMLLFSVIGCCFTLLCFVGYLTFRDLHPECNYDFVVWIPEVSMVVYAFCYRLGLGTIPTALCAEMFPLKHKAVGLSITFVILTLFDAFVVLLYNTLKKVWTAYYSFYILIGISMLNIPFVIFFVPETKGKTLEEIQESLGKGWIRKKIIEKD